MKKRNKLTALSGCTLLILLLGASSCSNNDSVTQNESKAISIKAFTEASSRLDYTEATGLTVTWNANDAFSLYRGTSNQTPTKFILSDGAGTKSGTFNGTLPSGSSTSLLAFYPSSTADTSPTTITKNIATQTGGTLSTLSNYDYMTTSTTYSESTVPSFTFSHRMAIIRFDITLPSTSVTGTSIALSATSGLYTTGVFNLSTDGLIISTNGTITVTGGSTLSKVYTVYAVVYPSTINGLSMTITTSDSKTYTKNFTTTSITLSAAQRYKVAYTIPAGNGGSVGDIGDGGSLN